jgi:tetratricopeptide (TPR) repeat protein
LKALELDETLAQAHASLGVVKFFYGWDWPGAERELRRAIELNPNYAVAHHCYGVLLNTLQRNDEAVTELQRALALDPLSLGVNNYLGAALINAGRYDDAIKHLEQALELDPNHGDAHGTLGDAYLAKGQYARAVDEMLKARALYGENPATIAGLRRAFERGGFRGFQERGLELALAGWDGWHVTAMDIAAFHASLGHRDQAMEWLEKVYQARSGTLVGLLVGHREEMKSLRSDPRFVDLVRRIGLPLPP